MVLDPSPPPLVLDPNYAVKTGLSPAFTQMYTTVSFSPSHTHTYISFKRTLTRTRTLFHTSFLSLSRSLSLMHTRAHTHTHTHTLTHTLTHTHTQVATRHRNTWPTSLLQVVSVRARTAKQVLHTLQHTQHTLQHTLPTSQLRAIQLEFGSIHRQFSLIQTEAFFKKVNEYIAGSLDANRRKEAYIVCVREWTL